MAACGVIPEIDIWRAALLLLKRYGERALHESAAVIIGHAEPDGRRSCGTPAYGEFLLRWTMILPLGQ